jgi:transcriptional regulator with XRE-family HTH domain
MESMTPSTIAKDFGKALREARKSRGLTQEDFAQVSGRTYVSSLERGLKSPTFDKMAELAQTLDIHPLTLLTMAYLNGRRGESLRSLQTRVEREIDALLHP